MRLPSILSSLLSQCFNLKRIQQTHGFMVTRGLDKDTHLVSQFIQTCFSLGFSHYAYSVFNFTTKTTKPNNVYLYNTMINSLYTSSSPKAAIFLYNTIQDSSLRPDTYSFPFVLKAVSQLSAIETGRQVHSQALRIGLDSELHVITALVQMYSSCGCVSDACKVFDGVKVRDVCLWNAMVSGYVKVCEVDKARVLFEKMPQRNVISWTCVISGYAQMNKPHEAIAMFRRMQLENVEPDEVAMLAALSACGQLGALELGEWIHDYIGRHGHGWSRNVIPLNNALIDMYSKSGNIKKALQVFENMKQKNVVTWTTMIAGLALHGLGREALEMFFRMESGGDRPNEITFIAILSACSHVGLVQIGHSFFNIMKTKYGIEPKIEHYGCMIDLLGRAGYLQEAQELLTQMPFEANRAIWGSLLAASNTHGDAKLGECALQHLIKLEPNNSGNYSLLSNIYASLGRWNESKMVRKVMRDKGVKKMPGGSFIEVNNRVHEFIAGETTHSQFDRIHDVLCNINEQFGFDEYLEKECGRLLQFGEG